MKLFVSILVLILFIFTGCGANKYQNIEASEKEQAVISTQKARLKLEDNSTLLIMATYLNNLDKFSDKNQDTIVLSIYFSPTKENNQTIGFPYVFINDSEAYVVELQKDDEIMQYLPSTNSWSKYYLVAGKKDVDFNRLRLGVEIYPFSKVELTLQKDF